MFLCGNSMCGINRGCIIILLYGEIIDGSAGFQSSDHTGTRCTWREQNTSLDVTQLTCVINYAIIYCHFNFNRKTETKIPW